MLHRKLGEDRSDGGQGNPDVIRLEPVEKAMKPKFVVFLLGIVLLGCEKKDGSKQTPVPASNNSPMEAAVNPNDILFSTSTLEDSLPADDGSSPAGDNCYRLHEDDWRQFEFIDASHSAQILSELAAIDKIWKEQSVPVGKDMTGFRNVHVRKLITKPLSIPMSVADFENLFGGKVSPITFESYTNALPYVYAIQLEKVVVYGEIREGKLTTLGIQTTDGFKLAGEVADRVEKFLISNNLHLVHWPSRTHFDSPQAAMKYLRGAGAGN